MAAVWKALLFFGVLHTGCLYAFAKVIKRTIVPHDAEPGHILLSLSNFGQEYTLDLNQVDEELSKFFTLTKIGDLITNQDISSLLDKSISLSINSANQDGIVKELVHIQVVKGGDMLVFQKPRYSGNVAENQPAGTIIQHLDITPRDTSRKDKIRYSLDSNTLLNVFALDVNNDIARIKTLVSLDREAVSHYEFKVLALNAVGEEATTTVSITVDDVNDNPPTLEQYEYSAEISHDIPIDTVITTIKATDPDENDAVTFALETPSSFFELNSATGDIVLKHRDGLSDKTYELVVYAKDSASHESNRATVTIELFGALKFKPLSRHRRATNPPIRHDVQETIQPGVFFRVTAQDVSNQNRFSMSDSELFSLDNQNGDLSLKVGKKLDYETAPALNGGGKGYTLNVEIKRDGTPDFLETVDVILSITDVNDEVPVFTNIPRRMLATMSANAPAGSNVYRLSASDPDAGSEVRFYKQSGDVDLFQVNEISGWITTKGANYIQNKEYKLTVYAQDLRGVGALPQTSTPSQVLIKVGERPPQFMFDPFRGDTPENVDVGTEVTQVSAFSFQSKQMRYSLVGDSNGRFSLEENGEILLLKTLDYETDPKTYTLLVTARESVTGLISTGTVSITLTDMNDNAPAFPLSTITTPPKSENTPVGTTIYTVEATDADSGVNSELTYKSLEPEIEVFTVGNKGNIVLVKKLDYESNAQHTYHFDIQVLDKGTPSKNGTVKMNVLVSNENDNAPYFSELLPKVDMSETAKSGDLITTLQAYDLDGDKVQFEVEQPNNTPFSVDADSGQITLTQALPPNPPASYTLKVLAKDDGSCCGTSVRNTNTTTVTIEVIDDVNSPPSFPQCDQYNPTVKEQQAFGTSVITVNAVDTDRGPNAKLVYSIIEDALGTKFTVNATSGEIKTAVTFDLEALPINNGRNSYPVTVRAKDSGVQPYEAICTFTVNIQDINDNAPKFDSSSYTRSIPRSADRDKQVFTLKATDKDLGVNSDITYSIDSQSVLHQFRVERVGTSASIILNKTLGLESRYDLVLRATDGGSDPRQLFTTVLVTINVNTGNKLPPLWEPPVEYVQQINENMGVNTAVYVIKAVSQNGGNVTSYAIINGGTPDTNSRRDFSRYANNKTHLVIRVNKPLDYEVVQSYTLRITAVEIIDGNKLYTEKVVNFAIIDKNDNKPNFIGVDAQDSYTFTVMENLNAGAEVISNIQAKDDDLTAPFNVVTYQVVDNSFFEMRNGKLFTKARFDREARKSYNFEVRATDGAVSDKPNNNGLPNSGTCLVIINIGDENDNKPEFTNSTYTATINENELTKSLIQVTATDLDEALLGDLTYSIIAGNIGSKFNVDPKSGEIAVIAGLDYEDIKQYTLTYRVSDKLNTATTTVIVNVKDVNDNAPVFSQSQYIVDSVTEEDTSISESNPLSLVTVSATDPDVDQNTQISFTLVLREGELPTFIINKATGEISLIRPLDRDTRAEYRVAIKATDAKIDGKDNDNPLSGHAELIVRPIDINDNAPTFSSSVLTGNVPENSVTGTTVMTIKADDADAGINAELVYTFGNSPYTSSFNIDPNTGVVTTAVNNLDREVTPRIEIPVIATDKGTPILSGSATATIMITDVNDVPPSFPQGVYKTDMPESLGKQASVYSVTCVDPDEGALTFSLIGTDDLKYFLIETNGKSGTLRLFKEIDYETGQKAFNLTVQVSDGISSATAYVEIQVLDSNDNVPEFETVQKQDEIPENQAVGSVVWTVTASDRDSTSPNNLFTFSIAKDSDPQGLFSVQRVSGAGSINVLAEVKIAKSLDRETVDTHTVKILAEDRGVLVQNTGTATLKIKVTDINDNCPIFKDNYQPQVMENKSPPRFVVNIEPVDADLPENNGPRFTCSLAPCNQQEPQCKFTGSSNTGGRGCIRIESKVTFDREAQKTYLVPIIMGDTGTPAMTCTNTLTVTIGDENDNPHGPGTKTVEVYNYKAWAESSQFQDVPLGTVYAPDKDDWDINEKTFTLVNTEKYFRMGSGDNHGNLMMLRGLPEGQHVVKVKVYDPKFPADVVSTMIVNCRMIGEEPVFSAGSFRAKGTAEDFIATPSGGKSKKTKFEELMAKALNTDVKNVDVFTVRNHDKDTFDVRFSAHGSPPYNESKLNMAIERNRQDFAGMGVDLLMVKVDECLKEDCEAGCTNTLVVTNDPLLVNSNSTSLVGVTSYITAECTCGARDFTKEEKCDPTSCYNGGTCIFVKNEDSSLNTYECQCLDGFMGPRCQETHHSFDGNSWAMYPTLAQCLDSKTSFEFITTSSSTNQLLMYNGPLNNPTNGVSDFIAVELVDGYPKVTVDHGTGATSVSITGKNSQNLQQLDKLNDGKWHKVDIIREGKKIRVVVDNCMSSTISSDGKTEDRSACEIEGVTPGENKFVNVNTPLQLGGRVSTVYPSGITAQGFDGCIKNFVHDSKLYDLHIGSTGEHSGSGSKDGCPREDLSCGVTVDQAFGLCGKHGTCIGTLDGTPHKCICDFGYMGSKCQHVTPPKDFLDKSYMKWSMLDTFFNGLSSRQNQIKLMVRTRDADGEGVLLSTLSKDSATNGRYALLVIKNGYPVFVYNLGSGEQELWLSKTVVVDGRWHNITLQRYGNDFILKMDRGDGRYYNETDGQANTNLLYSVDQNEIYGGGQDPDLQNSCMNDIRYDNAWFPMERQPQDDKYISTAAELVASEQIGPGCPSDACVGISCPGLQSCIDLWRKHECRCPGGYLMLPSDPWCADVNECLFTPSPCVHGTCINSPGTFSCECEDGYEGDLCDRKKEAVIVALGAGSIAAIVIAIIVLLILILALALWSRRRRSKPDYILEVEPDDDMRENIVHYDEDGAGEEDQDAYDISRLRKPVEPMMVEKPPVNARPLGSAAPDQPDVGNFIGDRLNDADDDPSAPPYDTLRLYDYEGDGSEAGSLSSLNSSSSDGSQNYDYLNDWGPRFQKLADMYGGGEED